MDTGDIYPISLLLICTVIMHKNYPTYFPTVYLHLGRVQHSLAAGTQVDWEMMARRTSTSCILLVDRLLLMESTRLRIALALFSLLRFIKLSLTSESWLKHRANNTSILCGSIFRKHMMAIRSRVIGLRIHLA